MHKPLLFVDEHGDLTGYLRVSLFPPQPKEEFKKDLMVLEKELSIDEKEKVRIVQNLLNLKLKKKNRIARQQRG